MSPTRYSQYVTESPEDSKVPSLSRHIQGVYGLPSETQLGGLAACVLGTARESATPSQAGPQRHLDLGPRSSSALCSIPRAQH